MDALSVLGLIVVVIVIGGAAYYTMRPEKK